MKQDIEELKSAWKRIRADLSATNTALISLVAVLTPDQQDRLLHSLGARSAERAAAAEKLPIPGAQESLRQIQESEERVYRQIQQLVQEDRRKPN